MKKSIFTLINAINCENIDNLNWGIERDIESTKERFGTDQEVELKGIWMYVYDDGSLSRWFKNITKETMSLNITDECKILLYKI